MFPFCISYYWQLTYVFDFVCFKPSKSQTIMPKSRTCGYSIRVPDTSVVGYYTAPTYYWSVNTMLLQSYPFEKRCGPFPSVTLVWVCGQMGYGPDLSWQQDCYLAISMSASLTRATPLYCSSCPFVLLCIWAKIRFFLGKVWSFELVYYCFLSPGMKMAALCRDN